MTDYLYAIDPVSGEARRFYRDGAHFVASGQPHPLGFWTSHPSVERISDSTDEDGWVTVRVWLSPPAGVQLGAVGLVKPDRPADYQFHGGGLMGDTFWQGHPSIEYFEISNHLGHDSPDQDCWSAQVWLRGS